MLSGPPGVVLDAIAATVGREAFAITRQISLNHTISKFTVLHLLAKRRGRGDSAEALVFD